MIEIDNSLQQILPNLRVLLLRASVRVQPSQAEFWQMAQPLLEQQAKLTPQAIRELPVLSEARKAYKALGQDPSRYRLSAEALLRRLHKGQELYRINNIVDTLNLVSLTTGFSIGGYDLAQIQGSITLRKGQAGEDYQGIGRGSLNIDRLPVLADTHSAFGNPTSDSTRTSIQAHTQQVLWVFFDLGGQAEVEQAEAQASEWLKTYAQAEEVHVDLFPAR